MWEERISILTGPNVFGKSTIINCINAFGNSNLEFFVDLNFKEIEIFLSDDRKVLCIKKMKDGLKINDEDFPESWIACFSRGMNLNNPYRTSGRMQDKEHQKKYQSYIRLMSQVFGNVTLIKEQRLIRHVRRGVVRSSGEKETIVSFYNLLFKISSGEILLIDEPEISLHIAWQRMFINDLIKIEELRNLTILVATHSPQMISGNRNIQIDWENYTRMDSVRENRTKDDIITEILLEISADCLGDFKK